MRQFLSVAIALAATCAGVIACGGSDDALIPVGGETEASTNTWKFYDSVVVADATAIQSADTTQEGKLIFPLAGNEAMKNLPPGTIVFGDRASPPTAGNSMGFLRKVQASAIEGDNVVLTTEQASMSELFEEAKFSGTTMPISDNGEPVDLTILADPPVRSASGAQWSSTFGLDTQGTAIGSGIGRFQASLTPNVYLNPRVYFDYHIGGIFSSTWVYSKVTMPFEFKLTECLAAQATKRFENAFFEPKVLFNRAFPAGAAGPIPLTINLNAQLKCFPQVQGSAQLETSQSVFGQPEIEFGYDKDWYTRSALTKGFGTKFTSTLIVQGSGGLRCELQLRVGIYLAGALGAYVQYLPGVEANLTGTGQLSSDKPSRGEVCIEGKATQEIGVGVEAKVFDRSLFDYSNKLVNLPDFGEYHRCADGVDSCAGKADGWYCSDLADRSAFRCANQSISAANACVNGQYCERSADGKAIVQGGEVKCTTTKPKEEDRIELLTCVKQTFPGFSAATPAPGR